MPSKALRTTGVVVNTAEEAQAGSFVAAAAPTGEIVAVAARSRGGFCRSGGRREMRWFVAVAVFVGAAAAAMVSLFERAGLTVIAYPVDFQAEASRTLSVMDFVPSARAFKKTEMASRETIGRVYYEFKGF